MTRNNMFYFLKELTRSSRGNTGELEHREPVRRLSDSGSVLLVLDEFFSGIPSWIFAGGLTKRPGFTSQAGSVPESQLTHRHGVVDIAGQVSSDRSRC